MIDDIIDFLNVKYILYFGSVLLFVCGIMAVTFGIRTLADRAYMAKLLGSNYYSTIATVTSVGGIIITIILFFVCYTTLAKVIVFGVRKIFITIIIVAMVFAIVLAGTALVYVFRKQIENVLRRKMIKSVAIYDEDTMTKDIWDSIQTTFECCGIETRNVKPGWHIWAKLNTELFREEEKVPESCCKGNDTIKNCTENPNESNIFINDCYAKLKTFFKEHGWFFAGIAFGTTFIVLLIMTTICLMISKLTSSEESTETVITPTETNEKICKSIGVDTGDIESSSSKSS